MSEHPEFDRYLADQLQDPEVRAGYEAEQVDRLAALRAGYVGEAIRLEHAHHAAITTSQAPSSRAKVAALRDQRGQCILAPFGWTCAFWQGHGGECVVAPAWWNLRERARARRRRNALP